jgi:uncharacterized protein YndB with AHSA1/START domain
MTALIPAGFVIQRQYDAMPERVFACYSTAKEKLAWLACHSNWAYSIFEFREGGREVGGDPTESPAYAFEGVYHQIIPNRRIAYAYRMTRDGVFFASSVTSIELEAVDGGTRLTFSEQSLFTDGPDTPELREEGTNWGLDQLQGHLQTLKQSA